MTDTRNVQGFQEHNEES